MNLKDFPVKTVESDVLVIGGGGAGLMAAIKAECNVVIAVKGVGATVMAPGGVAGVGSWCKTGDSKDLHFKDTVKGGAYLNEQKLVRILVDEAPDRILELERFGAYWEREDEQRYDLTNGGGHTYWRSVYLEDHTGRELFSSLQSEVRRLSNIRIFNNSMVTRILTSNGSVAGATAIDVNYGNAILFRAKAIILATGGAGELFPIQSQPVGCTGDGFAMALHAGAELIDMECVQFFPIGLAYPDELKGILCGTPYFVHLYNAKHERFMKNYDADRMEVTTRDVLSRAMYKEIQEGRGSVHGGIYADATYNPPEFFEKHWPFIYDRAKKLGLDMTKERFEVAPTVHYFMGGTRINDAWQTTVPGLFAAGEVAGGVHGANRLGQNSLADIAVGGARAGKSAGEYAAKTHLLPLPEEKVEQEYMRVYGLLTKTGGAIRPYKIRKKIQQIMWNLVGLIRTESSLKQALEELSNLRTGELTRVSISSSSIRRNREWIEALELYDLLDSAECTVRSAIVRRESRGAHYRKDYPASNHVNFLKHIVTSIENGEIRTGECPVDLSEIQPGN